MAALLATSRSRGRNQARERADKVLHAGRALLAPQRFDVSRSRPASTNGFLENSLDHGGAGVGPLEMPDASLPVEAQNDPELAAGMLEELMMSIREEQAGPSFVTPPDTPGEIRIVPAD